MNKVNLVNISRKLNLNENTIKKLNIKSVEDSFELSSKEQQYIDLLTKKITQIVNYDEMIAQLSKSKLYGSAYNFIDFTKDQANKICKVNIGLYNRETGMVDETSVVPNIFIDIFTNLTAAQIQKKPDQEKYYKKLYLNLLNHIEKNKQ